MTTAEIIALCSSVFAAASAMAAFFACFLNYRMAKPRVWIHFKQEPNMCVYLHGLVPDRSYESFVLAFISIANYSNVSGTIADIGFRYGDQECHAQTIGRNYEPKIPVSVNWHDLPTMRRKLPLVVPPYSAMVVAFFFPNPPKIVEDEVAVDFTVKTITRKIKVQKFKGIKITNISHDPNQAHRVRPKEI